ncbi:MAG: S-methyl-5'-thioadenosine phosphorylase [Anaerolineae bacterium]|nr:S-methyl-5'-thioadenosine phosphorylase [Anaerolineae bacterium]
MDSVKIGVIGGSGLYNMPGLTEIEDREIATPFGSPSGAVRIGTLAGMRVAFIARHGKGHVLTPTEVPYRANIYALKTLGVQQVISISAMGSLREALAPGHVVIPDQLVDFTRDGRPSSFFGEGLVSHISVADPFCTELSGIIAEAVTAAGGTVHRGGTAVTVAGPRFSTRGESALFRKWGCDLIGMTAAPEAFLAREAEMCYATMAHITDYDVWHESEEAVTVDRVLQTLNANVTLAQNALIGAVGLLGTGIDNDCDCHHALETALITARERIPAETLERLRPLVGKYLS